MKAIFSNVSAMCWSGMNFNVSNKVGDQTLVFGTYDGGLYLRDMNSETIEKIYQFSTEKSIRQILVDKEYITVLLEDGSVHRFSNTTQNFCGGPKIIAQNVDHMFSTHDVLMNDSTAYGYLGNNDTIVPVRNLEYFEGDCIFDKYLSCLAINRFMSTASVYTLNLENYKTWAKDTFSFDGEFMSRVGEYLQEHPVYCDDLDEEMIEQEEIMNSMLPESLVRSVHKRNTYVDFIKLYPSADGDNPFVVTGARDHRIIITDFVSHKVFFDQTFDEAPRCCCVSRDKIFVGCDNGTIVIINKADYQFEEISVGEERFKLIKNYTDKYIVAVNSDDAVFCLDMENMQFAGEVIENDSVIDVAITGDLTSCPVLVLTESGELLQMEM